MKMHTGVRYVVTKASDNGEFSVGDSIVMQQNGICVNHTMNGWMDSELVEEASAGMEVEVDLAYIEQRRKEIADAGIQ